MEYNFSAIEKKWQAAWKASDAYKVSNESSKPKYFVLDMFPYPSGAGLHVGHPLGYIASDIFSRYKRLKGFNVLHPMGYDAFGLPAEQYAIEHGVHPAVSTHKNIDTFRAQLDNIGFSYDWSREIRTCEPTYYKWTQWIFLQLFNSFYNTQKNKGEPILNLINEFEKNGNVVHACPSDATIQFTAAQWQAYSNAEQQQVLMQYRLAFCGHGEVNWCEALGTVLANDEVVNGVSERGGHPVVKKKLRQWYLRITAYADRLLSGLDTIEFSEAMKEMQTNWIGKSYGAEIDFKIASAALDTDATLTVYTTRPDTIFGVDFMVVAPEHDIIASITTKEQQIAVDNYIAYVKSRSDRERQAEKKISGCFTGAFAVNPFNGKQIPIWISEYVLAGYGTGAIMAVPCGDERDHKFAQHFNIPITNIIGDAYNGEEANSTKDAPLFNSDFLNGIMMRDAIEIALAKLEERGIGKRKVNYKMRDAAFSRQRYWGEPFPVQWKNGVAVALDESELPLLLPAVDSYSPGPEGEGPLANIPAWVEKELETNTMPGYAGSSWYFLRYMDPHNTNVFCDRKVSDYWNQVDLYIGGTEHAVGHLLYSRMWTKVLFDLGHIGFDEPFRKLLNQGMIQGSSRFVFRKKGTQQFISAGLINGQEVDKLHVDVNMVDGVELDTEAFKKWRNNEYANASFELENGKYICGVEVEKMSKSKYNVQTPDELVDRFGADTLRMYEMFLGPVEQSKPWDTKGITGVHGFLKKYWRLFHLNGSFEVNETAPTKDHFKILHKTIRKIREDLDRFSFNTGVSNFMICVNELTEAKGNYREILEQLTILLAPYAPHITAEIWEKLGHEPGSLYEASYPEFNPDYLIESDYEYPVSFNGKMRFKVTLPMALTIEEIQAAILSQPETVKWLEGKAPKKFIVVPGKIVNVVI